MKFVLSVIFYYFCLLLQYTCLSTQFKCRGNGTLSDRCILISKQCDGHPDCLAGEDEHNCPPKTCPPNQVKYRQYNNSSIQIKFEICYIKDY
jgi:hypothetical protein